MHFPFLISFLILPLFTALIAAESRATIPAPKSFPQGIAVIFVAANTAAAAHLADAQTGETDLDAVLEGGEEHVEEPEQGEEGGDAGYDADDQRDSLEELLGLHSRFKIII